MLVLLLSQMFWQKQIIAALLHHADWQVDRIFLELFCHLYCEISDYKGKTQFKPFGTRERAWQDLSELLDLSVLESMTSVAKLSDVFDLGKQIVSGKIKGRIVIDVNSI